MSVYSRSPSYSPYCFVSSPEWRNIMNNYYIQSGRSSCCSSCNQSRSPSYSPSTRSSSSVVSPSYDEYPDIDWYEYENEERLMENKTRGRSRSMSNDLVKSSSCNRSSSCSPTLCYTEKKQLNYDVEFPPL